MGFLKLLIHFSRIYCADSGSNTGHHHDHKHTTDISATTNAPTTSAPTTPAPTTTVPTTSAPVTSDPTICANNPCANGGSCTAIADSFSCTCAAGFSGTFCLNGVAPI